MPTSPLPALPIPEKTFRVDPVRPLAELRHEALLATPPAEHGSFHSPDLVDLAALDPAIKLDVRYASDNNFLGIPLYSAPCAFLQRPAAEALLGAQQEVQAHGYGLLVYDAYRPWYVTKMFWDATPSTYRAFLADPASGSRHNRGCAIDLGLYALESGLEVEMPSLFDEFTPRAHIAYPGGTEHARACRDLLHRAMTAHGFEGYDVEWWHFDFRGWRAYAILNLGFDELQQALPPLHGAATVHQPPA